MLEIQQTCNTYNTCNNTDNNRCLDAVRIKVDTVNAKPGDTVRIPVRFSGIPSKE